MLEIKKDGKNKCQFVVRSPQGQALLESIPFEDSDKLEQALNVVRSRIGLPDSFERRTDHEGRFRFALKGPGGQILGHSKAYRSEAGMENGIRHTREGFGSGGSKS